MDVLALHGNESVLLDGGERFLRSSVVEYFWRNAFFLLDELRYAVSVQCADLVADDLVTLLFRSADDFFQVGLGDGSVVVAALVDRMEKLVDRHEAFLVQFEFVFLRRMAQGVRDFF